MRVDVDITFDIEGGDTATVHVNGAIPTSALDVVIQRFHSGVWTGETDGLGTFYPARRLCSADTVYRTHCEHDACIKPLGKGHETHAAAMLDTEHTHTLPKPEPKKETAKPKPRSRR